jgi:membrane-bound ClpP family serine protease
MKEGQNHMGALSILLIAAGAILTFAVERQADGINIDVLGIILMVVGAIGLVASVVRGSMLGFSATRERRVSADGRTVVERDRTSRF